MARPKGSMNKNSRGLLARLKQQYGDEFEPIMRMAEQAVEIHKVANEKKSIEIRKEAINAWEKIARFTTPQLKAIEVDLTSGGSDLPTIIELVAKK